MTQDTEAALVAECKELIEKYRAAIGPFYHKSKDWYFDITFSFPVDFFGRDNKVKWICSHFGYLHEWDQVCDSFAEALQVLKSRLKESIEDVKTWDDDW